MKNLELNSEAILSYFSKNLTYFRKSRSLTQAELAKKSGIPRSTITNFESGGGNPTLSNMLKLSSSLEIHIEELLSQPLVDATLIQSSSCPMREKNTCKLFNLLPNFIKGLHIDRFELSPLSGFAGVPHQKGVREYFICLSGQIEIAVRGNRYKLLKNDILFFRGDDMHSYNNLINKMSYGISILVSF